MLGEYFADLLVENSLVVEIKAANAICGAHVAQLMGYLKSTRLEHGLIINFGSYKFQLKKLIKNDVPANPMSRFPDEDPPFLNSL